MAGTPFEMHVSPSGLDTPTLTAALREINNVLLADSTTPSSSRAMSKTQQGAIGRQLQENADCGTTSGARQYHLQQQQLRSPLSFVAPSGGDYSCSPALVSADRHVLLDELAKARRQELMTARELQASRSESARLAAEVARGQEVRWWRWRLEGGRSPA